MHEFVLERLRLCMDLCWNVSAKVYIRTYQIEHECMFACAVLINFHANLILKLCTERRKEGNEKKNEKGGIEIERERKN